MPWRNCRCEAALSLADAAIDVIATMPAGDVEAAVRHLDDALRAFNEVYATAVGCCPSVASTTANTERGPFTRTAAAADPNRRFQDALAIVRPGGCNPLGIANAIADACRQVHAEGGAPVDDAAVRLMVTQLAWICAADHDTDAYADLIAICARRASSPAGRHT